MVAGFVIGQGTRSRALVGVLDTTTSVCVVAWGRAAGRVVLTRATVDLAIQQIAVLVEVSQVLIAALSLGKVSCAIREETAFNVVTSIHDQGQTDLLKVAGAIHAAGLFTCLIKCRQEHASQDRYDRDNDQQLDKGKSLLTLFHCAFSLGWVESVVMSPTGGDIYN